MKNSTSILTFVMSVFLTHACDAGVGYRTKISKYSTWCEDNISADKESFKGTAMQQNFKTARKDSALGRFYAESVAFFW